MTTRIKLNKATIVGNRPFPRNTVVDADDQEAKALITAGYATATTGKVTTTDEQAEAALKASSPDLVGKNLAGAPENKAEPEVTKTTKAK